MPEILNAPLKVSGLSHKLLILRRMVYSNKPFNLWRSIYFGYIAIKTDDTRRFTGW